MVDAAALGDRIEERKDLGTGDQALYAYWMGQEAIAEKEERKWIKRAREIVKRYRDERPESLQSTNRFNILWSNVQTLKPTLYARTPKPDVQRRFLDGDPNARLATTLLERCLSYSVEAFDFDAVISACVEDRLLPGRGVARVLYVPHYGEPIEEDKTQGGNAEYSESQEQGVVVDNPGDVNEVKDRGVTSPLQPKTEPLRKVVFEETEATYIFWEDYREGPARQWKEVPWVRYRSYLTREELKKRFKSKGAKVNLDYVPKGMAESSKEDPPADLYKKAVVHEIWDKSRKQVIWLAPGTPDVILDVQDDPLHLPDFYANPDPLLATTTNDRRIPVPDYTEYQDQARELDSITARIDRLQRALKVSGVYPGENKAVLQQLVDEGTENRLIPVGDWSSWSDKGGLKSFIEWLPIQQVAETLIQLYSARDKTKAILYELTGIGDIMRGQTVPTETLGAQELKANFATRRIAPQQKDVAKFARNLIRLLAGVIAEHFSAKTISMITGYPQLAQVPQLPPRPPRPHQAVAELAEPNEEAIPGSSPPVKLTPNPAFAQWQQQDAQWQQMAQQAQAVMAKNQQLQAQFEAAVALIKQDGVHGFKIEIETDSTIAPDEQAEKTARVEFLQQFVPLMQNVVPIVMGNPPLANLAKEITMFAARGFRVARPLEESIEQAFDALGKMPPPPPPGGDKAGPDTPQALAERRHETDTRAQVDQAKIRQADQKLALDAMKAGQSHQLETSKLANEQIMEREKLLESQQTHHDQQAFRELRATKLQAQQAEGLQ